MLSGFYERERSVEFSIFISALGRLHSLRVGAACGEGEQLD